MRRARFFYDAPTMSDIGSLRSAAYTIVALLVACGGSGAAVKRAPAPQPKVEPAPTPPAGPSAFEKRWSAACGDGGAVGQCPAPFDRPAVFVDVGDSQHAAPPFCGPLESPEGAAARDALTAKRKALKACFRGAESGTFVELGPDGTVVTDPKRANAARAEACVAKIAKRALAGLGSPQPARVIVLLSGSAKPGDEALSKESLDTVVTANASDVSACYDAALEVWPGLKGRIATSFVIWFDGQVALARTGETTLGNPMLECCINTAIRGWVFPKPKDGSIALVTFPFTLGSRLKPLRESEWHTPSAARASGSP